MTTGCVQNVSTGATSTHQATDPEPARSIPVCGSAAPASHLESVDDYLRRDRDTDRPAEGIDNPINSRVRQFGSGHFIR